VNATFEGDKDFAQLQFFDAIMKVFCGDPRNSCGNALDKALGP
jgi:hypothetical protein